MKASQYCRAKINLYLEVLNQRPDGFHDIATLFQTLNYADLLTAEYHSQIILEGGDHITARPEDNLIIKAAETVRKQRKVRSGIKFRIQSFFARPLSAL